MRATVARAALALSVLLVLGGCPARWTDRVARPAADDRLAGVERPDWGRAFAEAGGRGTFVLYHTQTGRTERFDPARAAARILPASTFKVYNALVALDAGVVRDVDSVFVWDGVERAVPAWNRDHSLRTGMAASVVWLYQRVAAQVRRDRYAAAFAREPFGNGRVGPTLTEFWLDGSLQVSADEEVRFVDRLRTGTTAFSDSAEAAVRAVLPVLVERPGARLVGKTGWGFLDGVDGGDRPVGWLVGWVDRPDEAGGPAVFALNVEPAEGPAGDGFEMGPARLAIATAILEGEGVLPPAP